MPGVPGDQPAQAADGGSGGKAIVATAPAPVPSETGPVLGEPIRPGRHAQPLRRRALAAVYPRQGRRSRPVVDQSRTTVTVEANKAGNNHRSDQME